MYSYYLWGLDVLVEHGSKTEPHPTASHRVAPIVRAHSTAARSALRASSIVFTPTVIPFKELPNIMPIRGTVYCGLNHGIGSMTTSTM